MSRCAVTLAIASLFSLVMFSAGCAAAEQPGSTAGGNDDKPRYGGVLRIGGSEPGSFDAVVGRGAGDQTFVRAVTNQLIAADDSRQPDPKNSLVAKWEILGDGKTIRLQLRDNVYFNDGTKFDASVVKWNIERVLDPKNFSQVRGNFVAIKKIEVKDPLTVVLHLDEVDVPLLYHLADRGGMMHSPAAVTKSPDDHGVAQVSGTGPYELVEWVKGSHVTVKRFKDYWRKDDAGNQLPFLDGITWQVLPDARIRVAALETKQVDLIDPLTFPGEFIDRVRGKPGMVFYITKGASVPALRLNLNVFPMTDVHLRRAISYSLDRKALMKIEYGELGEYIGGGAITPAFEQYFVPPDKGGVPPVERDLQKAREELRLAGYVNGFEWTTLGSSAESNRKRLEAMQAMQAEVGIKMNIKVQDGALMQQMFFAGEAAAFAGSYSDRLDPDSGLFEKYYCAPAGSEALGLTPGFGGGRPPSSNCVLEASLLLLKARRTSDVETRKRLYLEFDKLYVEHQLELMLGYAKRGVAHWDYVQGFVLGGDQKGEYYQTWLRK